MNGECKFLFGLMKIVIIMIRFFGIVMRYRSVDILLVINGRIVGVVEFIYGVLKNIKVLFIFLDFYLRVINSRNVVNCIFGWFLV